MNFLRIRYSSLVTKTSSRQYIFRERDIFASRAKNNVGIVVLKKHKILLEIRKVLLQVVPSVPFPTDILTYDYVLPRPV